MRHYEIVCLIHPNQGEQLGAMVERYRSLIAKAGGQVHRYEDWGRRPLAYPVQKIHKAHYILLNIECDAETLTALKQTFRFNDAVLRYLVLRRDRAVTSPSPLMRGRKREEAERAKDEGRKAGAEVEAATAEQEEPAAGERPVNPASEDRPETATGEPPAAAGDRPATVEDRSAATAVDKTPDDGPKKETER